MPKVVSIQRQMLLLTLILTTVLISASLSAFWFFNRHFQTEESRYISDAKITLNNAVYAVNNLIRFHQGMLDTLAKRHQTLNIIQFGSEEEIVEWTTSIGNLLPGAVGTALALPDKTIIGDPNLQRVGPQCVSDLQHFAEGTHVAYPPVHKQIKALSHFDLISPLRNVDGETEGLLFTSFRLALLDNLLANLLNENVQSIQLLTPTNQFGDAIIAKAGEVKSDPELVRIFEKAIPDTSWKLKIEVPKISNFELYQAILITLFSAMFFIGVSVSYALRKLTHNVSYDIQNIHQAMTEVLEGTYQPSSTSTRLLETAHLIDDIDHVATQLQKRQRELERDSVLDPLTGLKNRRAFDRMLEHDFNQSDRTTPAFLALIDLNDFKEVNDNYGHTVGDEVLKAVSMTLLKGIRSTDLAARIGGDEFALILRNTTQEMVTAWAKKFSLHFDETVGTYLHTKQIDHTSTLSIGICPVTKDYFNSVQEIVMAADAAMYQAKENKRLGTHFVLTHPM